MYFIAVIMTISCFSDAGPRLRGHPCDSRTEPTGKDGNLLIILPKKIQET